MAQVPAIDVKAEILRTGRAMVGYHHAAQTDTCVAKADLKAAKVYVSWMESKLEKSQAEIALLRFQVDQRGQRNDALETQNTALTTTLYDCKKNTKTAGWVCAGLGAAVGVLMMAIVN